MIPDKELREIYIYVLAICRRRVGTFKGGWHLAEDLSQETLLAVVQAMDTYEDRGLPLKAFAATIARNKCNDIYRRNSKNLEILVGDWMYDPSEPEPGPEEQTIATEREAEVKMLLEEMLSKLDERSALILRMHSEGLSSEQTGRRLGMKAGAVRVSHHRALKALRSSL